MDMTTLQRNHKIEYIHCLLSIIPKERMMVPCGVDGTDEMVISNPNATFGET